MDSILDSQNDETFGDISGSIISRTLTDSKQGRTSGAQVSLKSLLTVVFQFLKLLLISILPGISAGDCYLPT